jgi:coniferyl-aldehyde dehydrogenase
MVAAGGKVAPVIVVSSSAQTRLMSKDILGPVLPIRQVADVAKEMDVVAARDQPLGLSNFDRTAAPIDRFLGTTWSGGLTVIDGIIHLAQHRLRFGGTGAAGMGACHGRRGFEALSHLKAVLIGNECVALVQGRLTKAPSDRLWRRTADMMTGRRPDGGQR